MITMYLNNFRGFRNTIIPLENVNFLVGENSTGKSSFLGLINLLCSPDFWFSQNFNLPEYEFGGFQDILSAECKRNEMFSFGISSSIQNVRTKEKKDYTYIIFYNEKDALPRVAQFARIEGNKLLAFKQFKKDYRYLSRTLSTNEIPTNADSKFAMLLDLSCEPVDKFSELPDKMPPRAGFFPLLAMLVALTEGRKLDEDDLLFPLPLFEPVAWLAPIRTKPKRTYDGYGQHFSPEGEHTPYIIRKKLDSKKGAQEFRKALSEFGKESGLFYDVMIHDLGDDAASPFELMIRLRPDCALRINSVGYGVSQVLPLIVEMLARRKNSWFSMQQPEVHLHPRAQAALGDVIYNMAELDSKRFLIETHSDFTIDRFRLSYRHNVDHKSTAQVLFFERGESGNHVHCIPIANNGEYPINQPTAFRQFFLREQMNLLGL